MNRPIRPTPVRIYSVHAKIAEELRCLAPVCFVICWLLSAPAQAQQNHLDDWQWRNPVPPANTLEAVTYGNGSFVAVGGNGTILQSSATAGNAGYREWAAFYENLHGMPAGTLSDTTRDTDNDGLAALLEYALESLGADPFVPDVSVLPQAMIIDGSLVLDYPSDTAKTDIATRTLISSVLTDWHAVGDPDGTFGFSDVISTGTERLKSAAPPSRLPSAASASPFKFTTTRAPAPATGYDFDWTSQRRGPPQ